MLSINQMTVQFGGLTAIQDLSLQVKEGTIHSIIGPNGAGKSTVFNTISRFYRPNQGEIMFNGTNLLLLKPHEVVKVGIARSFQNLELFSSMTVLDNLLIGLHTTFQRNIFSVALQLPKIKKSEHQAIAKAEEMMDFLQISQYANEKVGNLAYGNQKMVDIGRAIMANAKIILLDEPVAGMNRSETARLSEIIMKLNKEMNFTVLVIEHDMSLVMKISDQITVMNFGQKIAEGLPNEVQEDPAVIKAYLGEEDNDATNE